MNLVDLKNYLTEKNLFNRYAWTGNMDLFHALTTSEGMDLQNSFQTLPLDAKWYIDYNEETDEFVFKVKYFTHSGVGVTKEYFTENILRDCPAIHYTDETSIRWIRKNDVYNIQLPEITVTRLPNTIIYPRNL